MTVKNIKTEYTEPIKQVEELMNFIRDLPDGDNKTAMETAIKTLSVNLNELQAKKMTGIENTDHED